MTAGSLRRSPLHDTHVELNAKLVAFGGWEMPLSYPSGTVAEHMACRSGAALFDVSHLGTVRVAGAGAGERLNSALTNDLGRIAPGQAQYTHLLDDDGSVLDDLIVWWVDDDRFDVMPNASNTARVREAVGGDDVTAERAVLALQGPQARAVMDKVAPEAANVPRFGVRAFTWRGGRASVAGTGYTGEDGLECALGGELARELWTCLLDAGAVPGGLGARDTLRLEAGLPLHGHELGPGITPLQAGLGWVVAWDKPAFRGRDALLDERRRGPHRLLRGLAVAGRRPPRPGYQVWCEAGAGVVTSGNFSPVLGRGIALAFLPPSVEPGAEVEIDLRGRKVPGEVVALPFVRRGGGRR